MITQEKLKELVEYFPETGEFIWKVSKGPNKAGSKAGTLSGDYIRIVIEGNNKLAHQWAFLFMKGYIPELIDHKNRLGIDNAWENLRESTNQKNLQNQKKKKSKSGYSGVSWNKKAQKWYVQVTNADRIRKSGGYFPYIDLSLAVDKANSMRALYHGEYAIVENFSRYIPPIDELNK
ncbi:HNH endonuclease [Citrobacter freundii]|uniref:HNH endonuclease n=1 Tax=Citrobacter freundii TaxID=546 RepID=UPI003A976EED